MKKNLLLLLLLACGLSAQAQVNFGVELGGGFSNFTASNPDVTEVFGFRGGAFVSFEDTKKTFFETGIFYEKKGGKLTGFIPHYADNARNMNLHLHYVGIFDKLGYHLGADLDFKFGAYLAYGFSGSGTIAYDDGTARLFEAKIANPFKHETFTHNQAAYRYSPIRPWDWGGIIEFDYLRFKPFLIRVSAYIGGQNLRSEYDKTIRNMSLTFSVVYTFKK